MTMDNRHEPIAIVGMSCRFPGASDPEALWSLVSSRQESVLDYPGGRTPELDAFYLRAGLPDGPASSRGGFLPDVDRFDSAFFEISPREAEWLDPQQRLLLETGWEALEDAGIPLRSLDRAGVFVGVWANEYERHATEHAPVTEFFNVTGGPLYGNSSRVAFQFNMRGPDVCVNAACGSSLVAVHLAVRSLRSGECSLALAGGANVLVRPEMTQAFSGAGMLSPEGRCKFGDESADGFVRSDGAGMLVLKRLSDALRDRDRVLALIRGTAVTNNGRSSGMLATPSPEGQERAMREALADAQVDPVSIDFVEAHGTGTRAGDPVEMAAMIEVFGRAALRTSPCRTASVKSNIGHTESAAGVASIIRTVQAMGRHRFPASLHVKNLNPQIDWAAGVSLEREGCDWATTEGRPRRAGVNGLGLTGTNAHVILEEAPQYEPEKTRKAAAFLLPVSASSLTALRRRARDLAQVLEKLEPGESAFADFVYTAAQRRTHLSHRLAVESSDAGEMQRQLAAFAAGEESAFTAAGIAESPRKVAFVFPGQGSQWVGMGRELLRTSAAFRRAIEDLDPFIVQETGWSVLRQLEDPTLEERLSRIDVVQPTLFAMEVALAAWWKSCGVLPDAVVGHSMGEVAAACVAGILSLRDAAHVICRRSALLLRVAGKGAMAVVELTREEAEEAIAGEEGKVSVAACNSQRSTVLAGDPETLDRIVSGLESRDVFCRWVRVDVASHSPQMDVLQDDLLLQLSDVKPQMGSVPLYSTVRASLWDGVHMDGAYWVDNLRSPVLFADACGDLVRQGFNTFVEISPHPILLPFLEQTATQAGADVVAVGSLRREEPETATALMSLGRLFAAGVDVDWKGVCPVGNVVSLPAYPWQRERFWMEGEVRAGRHGGHSLLGDSVETATGERIWSGTLSAEAHPWLSDHQVGETVLVPASAYAEMAIAAGRVLFGSSVVVEQIALTEALAVSSGSQVEIQTIAAPETASSFALQFFGREKGSSSWRQTGECRLRNGSGATAFSADVSLWEDAELSERAIAGGRHAQRMAELGYDFGPAFCCVDWMLTQDHTALAQIRAEQRRERYWLHPATVDAALQVLAHLLIELHGIPQLLLPVSFDRLEMHCSDPSVAGTPLLVRATADATALRGTVTIFDRTGCALLTIHGAELRPLERTVTPEEALYSLEWHRLTPAPSTAIVQWVLIGNGDEIAGELSQALQRKGAQVLQCTADAVMTGKLPASGAGVVWLAPLTLSPSSLLAETEKVLAEGAAMIARLAEQGVARISLVTRGTQAARGESVENVMAAGAWGMFAAVAHEYPLIPMGCIDLPGDPVEGEMERLSAALLESLEETRVAIRGNDRFGARLVPWESGGGERVGRSELRADDGFEIQQTVSGSLSSLEPRTVPADPPSENEVEIAVEAAGLNFLDVLRAMGVNDALSSAHFGGECAGTVVRVGADVTTYLPGDSVLAISPSFQDKGMLASRVRVPEALVARKPEGMTFAEAAGIPCVFLTAWYGLVKLAHLKMHESVLIHAGAGGVGQAAIRIAQWIGAEVWATAGSEEKRAYLRQLGVRHVMDSRTLDFSRQILAETGGRGVDVVLNSLAGAAIPAGLDSLAAYGRFVEIGKRDIWENSRLGMRPFLRNLSFFAVDLADAVEARRAMVGELLKEVMERFSAGDFSPAPTTVFPVSGVGDAFEHLARAAHIGKVVLGMNEPAIEVRRNADRLHANASYLITGGLGGVGLQIGEALVRHGARHLVLTSRHAPSTAALESISRLEQRGAHVEIRLTDVSDPNAVRALLGAISEDPRPLRGIVHAAGILDDGVAANLSQEKFHRVMAGKVTGALAIDTVVRPGQLDFLMYASSVAGVLGNAGQGNYAAANAMLDALAHRQRARNIPAVSIDWGTWSEVGLAAAADNRGARLETHGLMPLHPDFGQALLMKVLAGMPVQVAAMILDADRWCAASAASARSGLLDLLRCSTDGAQRPDVDGLAEFASVQGDELRNRLVAWLRQQVAAVLRLDAERVPEDKPVRSLGLDSLMALELRNRLERQLHMKLSATLVWNYPTIAKLAGFLHKRLEENRQKGSSDELPAQPSKVPAAPEPVSTTAGVLSSSEMLEAELLEAETLLNTQAGAP
jgi:acyl transferase domain-containing protein/NADPH:quinone reductase-like Zn-dependent oxidoreductase/NAD(P)-dependent dehydrogenase (short-subunit alcohol dehydrogenase family)/acyl carrier protein